MKNQPGTLKTHKNRPATMKKQSGTVKNPENQPGVVQGGYRRLKGGSDDCVYENYTRVILIRS